MVTYEALQNGRRRSRLAGEPRHGLSVFLSVVKVHPCLNVVAISHAGPLLSCLQVHACVISPATFAQKRVPDRDFLLVRPPATLETPFEDFIVRSALQCSLHKVIVIDAKKSC